MTAFDCPTDEFQTDTARSTESEKFHGSTLPAKARLRSDAQRAAECVSTYFRASADVTHSPVTCRVETLSRLKALIKAIRTINAANAGSS
jgi:hypothetical protein